MPVTEWSKSEGEEQILYINTYMESRKTVLMNLFTEKKWKHRHREWSGGHSRGRSCFIHCLLWLFCKPTDCSPRGSSVHEISQARILKWVVISSSRGFSWPRDQTHISCVSCNGRQILYHLATWEAQVKEKVVQIEWVVQIGKVVLTYIHYHT